MLTEFIAVCRGKTFRRWNTRKLKFAVLGETENGGLTPVAWCSNKAAADRQAADCERKGFVKAYIAHAKPAQDA